MTADTLRTERNTEMQEGPKPKLDAVLVFGSGPIVEINSREQAEKVGATPSVEDINFWSKTLADASAELVKRNEVREVLVMGGKTGGVVFKSEAELISERIIADGVSPDNVKQEQSSTNTLENLVNVLNLYIDNPAAADKYKNLGIVAQHYHLPRVRLLMDLFEIPYVTAFSSEKVAHFASLERGDQKTADEIDRRLDMNEAGRIPLNQRDYEAEPGFYNRQKGTEKLNIVRRFQENDVFMRELLNTPEYWITYIGRLDNEQRARSILSKFDQQMLQDRFQIDLDESFDRVRLKLAAIPRKLPVLDDEIPKLATRSTDEYFGGALIKRADMQKGRNTSQTAAETPHT